jgi:hypothetical protein
MTLAKREPTDEPKKRTPMNLRTERISAAIKFGKWKLAAPVLRIHLRKARRGQLLSSAGPRSASPEDVTMQEASKARRRSGLSVPLHGLAQGGTIFTGELSAAMAFPKLGLLVLKGRPAPPAPEGLRVDLNHRHLPMQFCSKCGGHRQVACEKCDGAGEKKTSGPEGEVEFQPCKECGGTGWVDCPRCSGPDSSTGGGDIDLDQRRRGDSMF